jgi:hypothetical protein
MDAYERKQTALLNRIDMLRNKIKEYELELEFIKNVREEIEKLCFIQSHIIAYHMEIKDLIEQIEVERKD